MVNSECCVKAKDSNKTFAISVADILLKVIRLMNKHPAVTMVKIFQVPQFDRHIQLYMNRLLCFYIFMSFGSEPELHFCIIIRHHDEVKFLQITATEHI